MVGEVVGENLGIHHVPVQVLVIDAGAKPRFERAPLRFQVCGGQQRAGPHRDRLFVLEHFLDQRGREAAGCLADHPLHQRDDTVGVGELGFRLQEVFGGHVLGDEQKRKIAHRLGDRGHLDDVAEQLVHIRISLGHIVPAILQTEGAGLRLEVGELPTGHFVQIHLGGGRLEPALEGRVMAAHGFPVV